MEYFKTACFYQIYPLGLLGAEWDNEFDAQPVSRLPNLHKWIPHLCKLGVGGIYLSPVFESSHHGYDTRDFMKVDRRLGTNEELKDFVAQCRKNGIKVVLDGVFNHVGREFWAFRDVLEKRESSKYTSWFFINFSGNSNYNDGFWYEGWEGHYDLVKLNLNNPEVKDHIFKAVTMWIDFFGIDGLRLDVAYLLQKDFIEELCRLCRSKSNDFLMLGEALHGDYNNIMGANMLDSVTNYECYKGLYSSFNTMNMFEIAYSLNRQFGPEHWTLYKGRYLFNFADNHDVTRIATIISEKQHLPLIYTLLFTMPGIPCVYYGSEWGLTGDKKDGDPALRPYADMPGWNELTDHIAKLMKIHSTEKCLNNGNYKQLHLTNAQFIFERSFESERCMITINAAGEEHSAHFNANAGCGVDLLTGNKVDFGGGLRLPPYSSMIIGKLS